MHIRHKYVMLSFIIMIALFCALPLTGCEFNTYSMVSAGKPSDSFAEFFEAALNGDDLTANELLYNYSWTSGNLTSDSSGTYSLNGQSIDGADALLINCVLNSRSYRIVSESDYQSDSINAWITVDFTSFDMGKFQKELTQECVTEIRERQLNGEVFEEQSQTQPIIEQITSDLLNKPKRYYTKYKYKIEMTYFKGKWRINLTNDFYKALSGYPD